MRVRRVRRTSNASIICVLEVQFAPAELVECSAAIFVGEEQVALVIEKHAHRVGMRPVGRVDHRSPAVLYTGT